MTIETERFPEARAIVVIFKDPLHPADDPPKVKQSVVDFEHEMNGPICRILDFNQCTLDFGVIVQGLGHDLDGEGGFKDPNITTYFVSTNPLTKLGVESIKQQNQYGNVTAVELFETREAAIESAKKKTGR